MCYTIAACFPFEPLEKCMTFKDIIPGLSRTLSFNFQDFPGSKWFSRTFQVLEFSRKIIQDFPGGVGTLLLPLLLLLVQLILLLLRQPHLSLGQFRRML